MEQKKCMIIRDLLPSYRDGLTGENTTKVVEEHLQSCEECTKAYHDWLENMRQEAIAEEQKEGAFLRKLRRYRYQMLGVIIGVIVTVAALVLFVAVQIAQNRQEAEKIYATEQPADYGVFEHYYGISELLLFPEKEQIEDLGGTVEQYVYQADGNTMYQNCQIFAMCSYPEEVFVKEKERLQNVAHSDTGLAAGYDEERYPYPAVYAVRGTDGCHEYALFLEESRTICYIYIQGMADRRYLLFEESYLPLDYGQNGMFYKEKDSYSIYPEENVWETTRETSEKQ